MKWILIGLLAIVVAGLLGVLRITLLSVDLVKAFCDLVTALDSALSIANATTSSIVEAINEFLESVTDDMIEALPENWHTPVMLLMDGAQALVSAVGGILGFIIDVPQALLDALLSALGKVVSLCAAR